MIPVAGKLSDMYNKKKVLLALFTIYIIGVVAGGFSNNFYFLIAARMMQGFSIASIPVAFSIIREILPVKKLAIGIGIFTAAYNGGSVIGIVVGANIIETLGWHSTFFLLIPISILLAVLIKMFVNVKALMEVETAEGRESRQPKEGQEKKEIDIKGTISIAITITSFLIALTQLQSGSNSNSNTTDPMSLLQVIIFSVVSLVSLAFFIRTERRSESPLVDLNLIKDKFF